VRCCVLARIDAEGGKKKKTKKEHHIARPRYSNGMADDDVEMEDGHSPQSPNYEAESPKFDDADAQDAVQSGSFSADSPLSPANAGQANSPFSPSLQHDSPATPTTPNTPVPGALLHEASGASQTSEGLPSNAQVETSQQFIRAAHSGCRDRTQDLIHFKLL
jgi:hypothetical protein